MPFVCRKERVQRALLCVFGKMRMFAIVHVGDGDDDEGDDEGRCSVVYLIVKPSPTSSARCGCDHCIPSEADVAKAVINTPIKRISLPNDAGSPGPSPAHIRPFSLDPRSAFIPRKCGAALAAAETAGFSC